MGKPKQFLFVTIWLLYAGQYRVQCTSTPVEQQQEVQRTNGRLYKRERLLQTTTDSSSSSSSQGCTFCADGRAVLSSKVLSNNISSDRMIGSIPCDLIEQTVGSTPADTDDCYNVQLQTYLHCGCPTYPGDRFCYICDSVDVTTFDIFDKNNQTIMAEASSEESVSTVATSLKKVIPADVSDQYYVSAISSRAPVTTSTITCNDLLFSRWDETVVLPSNTEKAATAGGNICKMNSHAAYYCGCAISTRNTKRDCSLCGSSSSTTSSNFIPSRKLPPFYTVTCDDIDRYLSLYTIEQCTDWNTTLSLIASQYKLTTALDLRSYCGCKMYDSGTSTEAVPSLPTNPCHVCPINTTTTSSNKSSTTSGRGEKCPEPIDPKVVPVVHNSKVIISNLNGLTCLELITALSYVTDDDKYCSNTKKQYSQQCCYPTNEDDTTTSHTNDGTEKDVESSSTSSVSKPKPRPVSKPRSTPVEKPSTNDEPGTVVTDDDPVANNYKPAVPSSPVPPSSSSLGSSPTALPPDSPPTDSDATTTTSVSSKNSNSAAASTIMVASPTNAVTAMTVSILLVFQMFCIYC